MKQKDVALIIFVTGISAIVSFALGGLLFGGTDRSTTVETVEPIISEFIPPNERFFNTESFNPTRTIEIGGSSNPEPFSETTPITEDPVEAAADQQADSAAQ